MNIFEQASRKKLRFSTARGELTTEQLWDLKLKSASGVSLDSIAIALDAEIKATTQKSFVDDATADDELLKLKFDVVMSIIKTLVDERKKAVDARAKAEQISLLKSAIQEKEKQQLLDGSLDELRARLATAMSDGSSS